MADYLEANISEDVVIETWEPEIGFLTNHRYHYPPNALLDKAVRYIWLNGPPPSEEYEYRSIITPDYVLVGKFSQWVSLYDTDYLEEMGELVITVGPYQLFVVNPSG
jgi:hypothetical protein